MKKEKRSVNKGTLTDDGYCNWEIPQFMQSQTLVVLEIPYSMRKDEKEHQK